MQERHSRSRAFSKSKTNRARCDARLRDSCFLAQYQVFAPFHYSLPNDRLPNPMFSREASPAIRCLTSIAIAIAITQSSCVPDAAPELPSGNFTNVRNSRNSRGLRNSFGLLASTAARFATIAGRVDADVNHPSWLS